MSDHPFDRPTVPEVTVDVRSPEPSTYLQVYALDEIRVQALRRTLTLFLARDVTAEETVTAIIHVARDRPEEVREVYLPALEAHGDRTRDADLFHAMVNVAERHLEDVHRAARALLRPHADDGPPT